MKIYNTLTREREEFVPLEPGIVKMYVCGPTVYSNIHIGNARPIIVFDAVRRYLEYKGYEVIYVTNFTDIDDKIIKRANEEGVDFSVISGRYIDAAAEDSGKLNAERATVCPRVTEEIGEIIEMITELLEKGFAYEKEGSVFFDTSKYKHYGELSKKKLKELEAGARVEVDKDKKNPADFVLWKPAKPGEPKWASPWGDGRPGWHIECSVMSRKYLGETIDIHAGGDDLIFPHHENELAQSRAVNGKEFVKYWMHNGMLCIDNKKMAKSEGNFINLRDIAKEFSYDVVRFFILSAHYRSPLNFSRELMDSANSSLMRIRNSYSDIKYVYENSVISGLHGHEADIASGLERFRTMFEDAMDDDFNTANGITAIFELVKYANSNIGAHSSHALANAALNLISELCGILGIKPEASADADIPEIERLIALRQQARAVKNFAEADDIRTKLTEMGIILKDTPDGVKWMHKGSL